MTDKSVFSLGAGEMNYRVIPGNMSATGGYFEISPGVLYRLQSKPSAWHRFWSFVLLGWKWKEKVS